MKQLNDVRQPAVVAEYVTCGVTSFKAVQGVLGLADHCRADASTPGVQLPRVLGLVWSHTLLCVVTPSGVQDLNQC